jgi:hypothetical protein
MAGGARSAPSASSLSAALLSPQQRLLLRALARGHLMATEQLVAVLYGVRHDGGPDRPERVVREQIAAIRRCLEPYGITVLTIGKGRASRGFRVDPDHLPDVVKLLSNLSTIDIERARANA